MEKEPELYELFNKLATEVSLPDFIRPIRIPILGKLIEKKINEGLVAACQMFMVI